MGEKKKKNLHYNYNLEGLTVAYLRLTTALHQIGKGVRQGCMSPCLFNFYAEYIMRNVGLDEAKAGIKFAVRNINNLRYADDTTLMAEIQAGIKIARRNINNLRYADDTTLMAESEEELKSLLKEE